MNSFRSIFEQPVSYDGCEPDLDGVLVTIREGDVFKLDLDSAMRLWVDLDAAITAARRGTERLLELTDPAISDEEAHRRLDAMGPVSRRIECGICYCAPHHGPCERCDCTGVRAGGRVYVDDSAGAMPA